MSKMIELEPSIEGKKRKNFTIIDNPFIDDAAGLFRVNDKSMSAESRWLLVVLLRYDGLGELRFSVKYLSEKIGKSERQTFRFLKELEEAGCIKRKQRKYKTDAGLIRQQTSVISLEPYWTVINEAQNTWAESHKSASLSLSSEHDKSVSPVSTPDEVSDSKDSDDVTRLTDLTVPNDCQICQRDKDVDKDNKDSSVSEQVISNNPGKEQTVCKSKTKDSTNISKRLSSSTKSGQDIPETQKPDKYEDWGFGSLHTQFQHMRKNGAPSPELTGIVYAMLNRLGVTVTKKDGTPNFSVAGKVRKLGDKRSADLLWKMWQMKRDGVLTSPNGYLHSVLGGKENGN